MLAASGCGGDNSGSGGYGGETEGSATTTIAGVAANDHGTKTVSAETEVELDDDYFEPTVLQGGAGAKVTLELKNEGGQEHNFTVDAQQIDQDVEAGEDAKVSVTLPQSGQLVFYCKYHKAEGMVGALEASG